MTTCIQVLANADFCGGRQSTLFPTALASEILEKSLGTLTATSRNPVDRQRVSKRQTVHGSQRDAAAAFPATFYFLLQKTPDLLLDFGRQVSTKVPLPLRIIHLHSRNENFHQQDERGHHLNHNSCGDAMGEQLHPPASKFSRDNRDPR